MTEFGLNALNKAGERKAEYDKDMFAKSCVEFDMEQLKADTNQSVTITWKAHERVDYRSKMYQVYRDAVEACGIENVRFAMLEKYTPWMENHIPAETPHAVDQMDECVYKWEDIAKNPDSPFQDYSAAAWDEEKSEMRLHPTKDYVNGLVKNGSLNVDNWHVASDMIRTGRLEAICACKGLSRWHDAFRREFGESFYEMTSEAKQFKNQVRNIVKGDIGKFMDELGEEQTRTDDYSAGGVWLGA